MGLSCSADGYPVGGYQIAEGVREVSTALSKNLHKFINTSIIDRAFLTSGRRSTGCMRTSLADAI